jgi:autophagy-related protein 16
MAVAAEENKPWRKQILLDLQERNRKQCDPFTELFLSHGRLLESSEGYRVVNQRLTLEVERLRRENEDLRQKTVDTGNGAVVPVRSDKMQALEQKLYNVQEELMEVHREKGKNAQMVIDLNNAVQERDKQLAARDAKIKELELKVADMSTKCQNLEQSVTEFMSANQLLLDEHEALQMAYTSLEGSLRRLQDDNNELVTRWMALKAKDADRINAENEQFQKEKIRRQSEAIQQAVADTGAAPLVSFDRISRLSAGELPGFVITVPSRALQTLEAHDSDVCAIKWSMSGQFFASGGSDRKLKVWEVHGAKCDLKCILTGCNATITSIDIDIEDKLLLAASNDFASRIWTWNDQRLRHTLTGHSGKVLAAKFIGDSNIVVSGSHDRTLKLWDIRTKACTKTIFAGSSCNDLVVFNSSDIISGHFDKTVRFYDVRSDCQALKEIQLQGRITSLDLTADKKYLLGCTRDNDVAIIDLKTHSIVSTLVADGFHVAVDHTRAVFSPDGEYIAAGSVDGGVYVWEVAKSKLHSVLREHKEAVMACAWNPTGRSLLSCDRHRNVVYWTSV